MNCPLSIVVAGMIELKTLYILRLSDVIKFPLQTGTSSITHTYTADLAFDKQHLLVHLLAS